MMHSELSIIKAWLLDDLYILKSALTNFSSLSTLEQFLILKRTDLDIPNFVKNKFMHAHKYL